MAYGDMYTVEGKDGYFYEDSNGQLCPYGGSSGGGGASTPFDAVFVLLIIFGPILLLGILFINAYLGRIYASVVAPILENNEEFITLVVVCTIILTLAIVFSARYFIKNTYSETKKSRITSIMFIFINVLTLVALFLVAIIFAEQIDDLDKYLFFENFCAGIALAVCALTVIGAAKSRSVQLPVWGLLLAGVMTYSYLDEVISSNTAPLMFVFAIGSVICALLLILLFVVKLIKRKTY